MGKRSKPTDSSEETQIDIDNILKLGGEKKDADLITNVEDELEAIDCTEDFDAEPIKKDEVREFIKQLGFDEIMNFVEESEESTQKKTKQKKSPSPAEESPEKNKSKPQVAGQELSTKKEKKKKNKFKIQDEQISSTTTEHAELSLSFIADYQPRKYLIVKPGDKWFGNQFPTSETSSKIIPEDTLKSLQDHAARIYRDEVAIYKSQQASSKNSNVAWIRTVLTSGTLSDKMAALTLLIQEAPLHNLSGLEQMVTMVKKKGRREALLALNTLKELYLSELLIDDRKLKAFIQQPLYELEKVSSDNKDAREKRLLMWHYEAKLRDKYIEFVQALEVLCHDNISAAKQKALGAVFELLAGKPEQEKKLLSIMTNKLGDPDYKVASKASHLLTKLVEKHPNMKNIIVAEVERLMYRPNVAKKAQYYAVCFLNQIILDRTESDLSLRLINIYFSFFKAYVKKGDVDSKMLSALLSGVNRAYPYAKVEEEKIAEQMDTLYKIVHIVNFNTSIQALMLLYQVMGSSERTSDRYYQALYSKILDPGLLTSSKQAMFLNLLFKSMNKDPVDRRIKAFIKRLLQACSNLPVPFICGSLVLLSEILKAKPSLFQFNQFSQDSDDEDEHFVDIKTEEDSENELKTDTSSDDEDKMISTEEKQQRDVKNALEHKGHLTVPSWVHRRNTIDKSNSGQYDPQHRNPLYARAETECVWELKKLTDHFHPSVALFAKTLLKGQKVVYSGDPLEDFTLIRFLDRFVFRNPKKRENVKADKGGTTVKEHLRSKPRGKLEGAKSLAINSEEYVQLDEERIPVDEKFFHRYFKKQALKKKADEEIDSDVDDDEFDDFLDTYEKGLDGAEVEYDFAGEFSKKSTKDKKSKRDESESEEDDDLDLDEGLSDEEVEFSDEDMLDAFEEDEDVSGEEAGFDEEGFAFSDDDIEGSAGKRKAKNDVDDVFLFGAPPSKKKGRKAKEMDSSSLFAAAEEFSHLMDETSSTKLKSTGTEALSNRDKADVKQLNWESNRDKWVKGQDWKSKKRQRGPKQGFKGKAGKPGKGSAQKSKMGKGKPKRR